MFRYRFICKCVFVSVYTDVCVPVHKGVCVSVYMCVHGAKGCNHVSELLDDDNVSVLDRGKL